MLHPCTELKKVNDDVGYGVFATTAIPRGTITWALDPLDQILDPRRTEQLERQFGDAVERYTWVSGTGKRILCWDFGRFMNHACVANSYGPGGCEFEIAVRDIAAGEQLTSDYGTLNLEEPLECRCGAPGCRGIVRPGDLEEYATACDLLIRSAFPQVLKVPQPLWQWVADQENEIKGMVLDPETVPSVVKHRWVSPPQLRISNSSAAS